MSSHDSSRNSLGTPLLSGLNSRYRIGSSSGSIQTGEEQLAQTLDKIHNTASKLGSLTTFNEFASTPSSSLNAQTKGIAGDLMQNGISGLYNRFCGAVGAMRERSGSTNIVDDQYAFDGSSARACNRTIEVSKSITSPQHDEIDNVFVRSPRQPSGASSRIQSPTASSFAGHHYEPHLQTLKIAKGTHGSTLKSTSLKSTSIGKISMTSMSKATTSSAVVPTVASVNINAFKEDDLNRLRLDNFITEPTNTSKSSNRESLNCIGPKETKSERTSMLDPSSINYEIQANSVVDGGLTDSGVKAVTDSKLVSVDSFTENGLRLSSSANMTSTALSFFKAAEANNSTASSISGGNKKSVITDCTSQSHLPAYKSLRASMDRSIPVPSIISTSENNSVRNGSFSINGEVNLGGLGKLQIPGMAANKVVPDLVNSRLERMRKQVLSKEFWMADEICKECFLCGDTFSAFRRKHHCRTCGCIFDSKCTSIISGQRFGVQGSLRICVTCLDIINRRHDSSASDDSADDATLPSFFQSQQAKYESSSRTDNIQATTLPSQDIEVSTVDSVNRPLDTPMMAIPATRRIDESENRRSAILEIDIPQLSRPSSSKSLRAPPTGGQPPPSGHKRHHSKQSFIGRFKAASEERPPFHRGINDEVSSRSKLPAFHDDNIIDPDLAPYMSDEGSSADEQISIFAAMNHGSIMSPTFENDRSGFGSLLSSGKRHRIRTGDKSISGASFTTRNFDDNGCNISAGGYSKASRRRNLSSVNNNLHCTRTSPLQQVTGLGKCDEITDMEASSTPFMLRTSRMTRSASMRDANAPAVELNDASLHHVRRLLRQLLEDANIPNLSSWEKALVPILLRSTDDVNPNVRAGDDIDIRHYVKLKKIPGGKPGDTAYVSGVVFTKNLALKSMSRSISNPRIVIVSFPIEYQRHQHHFMSLEPVIAQEKEFLRNMVNRIASLQPQLLLVQKHVSGLALQYLTEANIAVAYNVKQSVIEAVSRCAQTEIISSIDMVALKQVHIGKSAGFDLKTYVHNDIPRKKKTYVYLSGCSKDLGCTIVLRGANTSILSKMKRITEFMVYVVYNLKLETCLMRDEFVLIPSIAENNVSLSCSKQDSFIPRLKFSDPEKACNTLSTSSEKLNSSKLTDETIPKKFDEAKATSVSDEGQSKDRKPQIDNKLEDQKFKDIPAASKNSSLKPTLNLQTNPAHESQLPEDIPMPTFYSDIVAKHRTKILSASPFVKFMLPYLLMQAREQERRLIYFKRLRDQDNTEESTDTEKTKPLKFQLIKPEMVHDPVKGAPRQIMEVLHAVHDAEYDKALHNYQTQKRQWENYLQGSLNLFEPYAHQNITVLYTVVCTATFIPCAGPELLTLAFYNEHAEFDPDCTLGQYVEDLCLSANATCTSNGCERKMSEHHRTYVHGEARITVFVENFPCKIKGLQDSILMWSYCKICQKETPVMPMSENSWKYSLGKYLELSFWSSELRLRAGICPHDIHRNHIRYFGYRNIMIRIHYDPIDLLEIIVPRTRITWKVEHDLRLKNDIFSNYEKKWNRFMASVNSRIKGINIDSVAPEKVEACKAEVDRLARLAQEEHGAIIRKLQKKYMESKYYEIIPLNRAARAMQEKVVQWDDAFAEFDANFFPSDKDIRQLVVLQLGGMFIDREDSSSPITTPEPSDVLDLEKKILDASSNLNQDLSKMNAGGRRCTLPSVVEENRSKEESKIFENDQQLDESRLTQPCTENIDLASLIQSNQAVQETSLLLTLPTENLAKIPLNSESHDQNLQNTMIDSTLPNNIEKPRKANSLSTENALGLPETSGIPRPTERIVSRRNCGVNPPALIRTQSQPPGATCRKFPISKTHNKQGDHRPTLENLAVSPDIIRQSGTELTKPNDKKFTERLSLGIIKAHRKAGHSMIPRSINNRSRDSKSSTLAKHVEQLSREFEKERLRDRKQREPKCTQSRAFPKLSSKPIVEVYKDVNEAVEDRGSTNEYMHETQQVHSEFKESNPNEQHGILDNLSALSNGILPSPTGTATTTYGTITEGEDNRPATSRDVSDDNGEVDDQFSPGKNISIGSDIFGTMGARKSSSESPLDIPKGEKSSLLKTLTKFWAERSASGWTTLDYPMSAGDHIFADVDVIVREDEPSSLIAFALQTQDYKDKLEDIRSQGQSNGKIEESLHPNGGKMHESIGDALNEAKVETSLLRATGTHLAYSFDDGPARMHCKIYFAEQFDAVRRKCGVSERIVESLSRCLKWDSKGGKTKSVFLKTLDDRLVLKSLSQIETEAFLKFAPAYFNIMAEALFHDLPTVIAKLLGFYEIIIKNQETGTEIKWDVLLMENLFYDRYPTRIFDLKGSMRNRKIQSTGEQNEVLLDENMVEFIYESPLFAREHSKKLLRAAIFNDTLFLQRNDVMDYSLMIAVDEARKELVVGIIDVVRTYTWDKKLESWIKDRGFAGGGRNRPTVTSPKEYKSRFREAMNRYILQAPNSWHQEHRVEPIPQKYIHNEVEGDKIIDTN
ncbi:BgTH12-03804 [Blumeria graminis f. sp. triticale]|uniref:1-phosphatidylinositol-3-phosphate 5-kinase n=1 Tax=Blumeria graminis f. sp. triticale TaxID=1689686 RepID=A0A9W4CWB1_BLUGR|nr:BgTH12-03804 [Blumeria graminis f. sp. triticale]